jgi:hypothetical protein
MFWVKSPEELHNHDIGPTLKRQSVVNMFMMLGATGAAVMLLIWVVACGGMKLLPHSSIDAEATKKPGAGEAGPLDAHRTVGAQGAWPKGTAISGRLGPTMSEAPHEFRARVSPLWDHHTEARRSAAFRSRTRRNVLI